MSQLFSAMGGQGPASIAQQNGMTNLQQQQLGGYFNPTQASVINTSGQQPYNAAQQQLLGQLQQQAMGGGPNLAVQQLQQATQGNIANQAALAASQRGNQNPGAMQYQLGQQ